MLTCTFFGHRNAPKEIKPTLMSALIDLIENKNVLNFYVGNQGSFDQLVKQCLIELKEIYPINYTIVLAYIPKNVTAFKNENYKFTILPECIETVPKKFAIVYRNRWMIEQSAYVITYVKRLTGGAAQFKELAEKKEKTVINITD